MDLLTNAQSPAEPEAKVKVGEMFLIEGLAACNADFVISTLQYWSEKKVIYVLILIIWFICRFITCQKPILNSESTFFFHDFFCFFLQGWGF